MAKLFQQALFNQKRIAKRQANAPTPPAHKDLLHQWAATISDQSNGGCWILQGLGQKYSKALKSKLP